MNGFNFEPGIYLAKAEKPIEGSVKTIEAFIKVKHDGSEGEAYGAVIANYFEKRRLFFEIKVVARGVITFTLNGKTYSLTDYDIRTDTFTHLAIVRDTENKKLSFYINGELKASFDCDEPDIITEGYTYIGNNASLYSYFRGVLSDLRIWNVARTKEQINKNMYSLGDDREGLISNWLFDEKGTLEGSIFKDSQSHNDAVLKVRAELIDCDVKTDHDFTFAVIPDPQSITGGYTDLAALSAISDWVIKNRERENITYAVYLGDIANAFGEDAVIAGRKEAEYKRCKYIFDMLDDADFPYIVVAGNHDYDDASKINRDTLLFNSYFPYSKYAKNAWFGGAYEEGKTENTYYCFTAGDIKFMVFSLEFGPRDCVLEWAGKIVSENPDYRVIVTTHSYLYNDGELIKAGKDGSVSHYKYLGEGENAPNDADGMWDKFIKKYKNIFLVLSGHILTDDVMRRCDIGECGNEVYSIMSNAQGLDFTIWRERPFEDKSIDGLGMVLLLRFSENGSRVSANYYSPYLNKHLGKQNQFDFEIKQYK